MGYEFIKPRRKTSFKERIQEIGELLNKQGEVSLNDLFKKWKLSPYYIKTLMTWAKEVYSYAAFDEEKGVLFIPERRNKVAS